MLADERCLVLDCAVQWRLLELSATDAMAARRRAIAAEAKAQVLAYPNVRWLWGTAASAERRAGAPVWQRGDRG